MVHDLTTQEGRNAYNEAMAKQVSIYSTKMNSWIEQLQPIIDEYKDGSNEPLDGDDVNRLTYILKAKINLQEGNITQEEYDKILG